MSFKQGCSLNVFEDFQCITTFRWRGFYSLWKIYCVYFLCDVTIGNVDGCLGRYGFETETETCQKAFNIKGVLAPVFTPMDDAGRIRYDVIPEYAEYLTSNDVNGILVGGTTGESASMNVAERKKLLSAWIEAVRPMAMSVISQVGGVPLPDVLELARYSEELGADAIMTLPELYYKPRSVDQLVAYLELVSDAAPTLPLVYYHFPMISGVDVDMRNFFATAKARIPNFKGMKADLSVAVQVVDQLSSDQRVFIANHHLAPAALMGHESSIATVTNLFPSSVQRIVEHVANGDVEDARRSQSDLNRLVDGIASHGDFVPSMKAAMKLVTGLEMGPPRPPLTCLTHSEIVSLENFLQSYIS